MQRKTYYENNLLLKQIIDQKTFSLILMVSVTLITITVNVTFLTLIVMLPWFWESIGWSASTLIWVTDVVGLIEEAEVKLSLNEMDPKQ